MTRNVNNGHAYTAGVDNQTLVTEELLKKSSFENIKNLPNEEKQFCFEQLNILKTTYNELLQRSPSTMSINRQGYCQGRLDEIRCFLTSVRFNNEDNKAIQETLEQFGSGDGAIFTTIQSSIETIDNFNFLQLVAYLFN